LKKNDKIASSELDELIDTFYYENFYSKCNAEKVDSMLIAAHLYDHAVNGGIGTASKLLQQAVNKVYKASIKVDGVIGNVTLGYVNGSKTKELEAEMINQRNANYKGIVKTHPSYSKFLNGWLNRVSEITKNFS
jgi:lysozyme family protein